jgi:hypothetical protein
VQAGVADGGDFDVVVAFPADRAEAEEGEEQAGFDALGPGAGGCCRAPG